MLLAEPSASSILPDLLGQLPTKHSAQTLKRTGPPSSIDYDTFSPHSQLNESMLSCRQHAHDLPESIHFLLYWTVLKTLLQKPVPHQWQMPAPDASMHLGYLWSHEQNWQLGRWRRGAGCLGSGTIHYRHHRQSHSIGGPRPLWQDPVRVPLPPDSL